ncbi:MAG: glucokinase [Caldilineales bacterium]|nr:glucokinase [Caldilineales bacterium]
MLLAGDIGGTKTILALYARDSGPRQPLFERIYASGQYTSLTRIVQEFLAEQPESIEAACFGVAGPVIQGQAEITNLPWVITTQNLQETLGVEPVLLMNDLQAIANAVPALVSQDLFTLNAGRPVLGGAMAVIAPGTGLGEAYLTWDGSRYHAYASEGGHTDFGPNNTIELEMLRWLQQRMDHVSYEWVCSGKGIPNIYAFLKDSGLAEESPAVAAQLVAASDPTPVIVNAALREEGRCQLSAATLEIFVSILGAEAGNLALKVLATAGVYVGGGIPPRILPALREQRFMQSFLRKGRFSDVLYRVPVHVILNPRAALLGAAHYGLEWMMAAPEAAAAE